MNVDFESLKIGFISMIINFSAEIWSAPENSQNLGRIHSEIVPYVNLKTLIKRPLMFLIFCAETEVCLAGELID